MTRSTHVFRRVAKQSVAYGLASLVGPGTGVLLLPLYTRFLSPAEYGLIALLEVISLVLGSVLSLGMPAAIPFYYVDRHDDNERRRGMGSVLFAITLVNTLVCAAVLAGGAPALRFLLPSVPFAPYVPLLLLTAFLDPYWVAVGSVLQIRERAAAYSAYSVARIATSIATRVWYVVVLNQGVLGFVKANLWTSVIWAAIAVWLLRPEVALALDRRHIRRALALGGPTVPNNLLTYGFRLMDRMVMDRFVARDVIGLYYMAVRIGDVLRLAAETLVSAWRPVFFKEADDPEFRDEIAPRVMRLALVLMIGASVGIALFARELIRLLTAPSYAGAARYVPFIAAAMALKGAYAFPYLTIWHKRQTYLVPLLSVCTLIVSFAANWWLGSRYGAIGVAGALVISYLSLFALVSLMARRLYPLRFPWRVAILASAIGVAVVAAGAFAGLGIAALAIRILLALAYIAALFVTGCVRSQDLRYAWRPAEPPVVAEPLISQ